MKRLAVAVLLAACGSVANHNPDAGPDGPDPDDGMRSGTRLKLIWTDYSGTRQLAGAHDAMLDADCYPQGWDDGATYCVPGNSSSVGFTDAACTQAIGIAYIDPTCGAPPPDYFIDYAQTLCSAAPRRLYGRGAAIAATQYYSLDGTGACVGPSADPNYHYYTLGAELPSSALIELTATLVPSTGRYAQGYLESADGGKFLGPTRDTQLGTTCYMSRYLDTDAVGHCQLSASYAPYFGDAACSQPKAGIAASCAAPAFLVSYPQTTCPEDQHPTYYAAGGAGGPVYADDSGACAALVPDPGTVYYASTSAVSIGDVAWARDAVAGRQIQLAHFTDGDVRIRDYGTYDEPHDTRCYGVTENGATRCLPLSASVSEYFTDPACANPIDLIEIYDPGPTCAPPALPALAIKFTAPTTGCEYRHEVYTVGSTYTGPLYSNFGVCAAYTTTNFLYRTGASVPLTEFAVGTRVVDP